MRMIKWLLLLFAIGSVSAQRYEVLSGSLEVLGNINEYNVTFSYDGMKIHGYDSEEAFLKEKVEKRQKSPEKAEAFAENWYAFRESKYEPRFIDYFNGRFENAEVKMGKNPSAKYTLNVKTTWLYPGYGIGMGGEEAKVSAILTVFETANPSKVLLSLEFDKSIGLANKNYNDFGDRISGAYEKLAKNLVMQVKRFK
ncbi:hypothetical protein HUK80_10700 [Flavobacterium sp. MAH-1]|uniref:DUF4136 domain-containing protein n=1 Tax=Flavobacterium agri TaxID=2743471 RepID=A0A7Y8Y2Q1_9FLAO|nr:hypothetical protein [Flavobacterium agri]NUY81367.1 hypothetical protein [Flavobacterium agri]NYA71391.1 hypothetical protein [Flavobacterium agri]